MDKEVLVVIGKRTDFLKFLEDNNYPFVLLADSTFKTSESYLNLKRFYQIDLIAQPYAQFEHIAYQIQKEFNVKQVIPVVEFGVVGSAIIRKILGLSGVSMQTAVACTNKIAMKTALKNHSIQTSDFYLAYTQSNKQLFVDKLGFPLVYKKYIGMGGRGTVFMNSIDELPDEIDKDFIFEPFVEGKERSIESFIANSEIIFTNITDYYIQRWANILPAKLPSNLKDRILELNKKVINALEINTGVTHLEFFYNDKTDQLIVGEIAIRPPGGHIFELMNLVYGFNPWKLYLDCLLNQVDLSEYDFSPKKVTGCLILHPGEGVVKSINGQAEVGSLEGFSKLVLKKKIGSKITERLGSGQEMGYLLVEGKTTNEVENLLDKCSSILEITTN